MSATVTVLRCGPLSTIQDRGRVGTLKYGVSASGPMDATGFASAGLLAGASGAAGIELTSTGIEIETTEGQTAVGWAGGDFRVAIDGVSVEWPGRGILPKGSRLSITTGAWGNFGYLRFGGEIAVPQVMGSQATSTRARLGGLDGRALKAGDSFRLSADGARFGTVTTAELDLSPIRFIWGVHAENFSRNVRERFEKSEFLVTSAMDRMGYRLGDPEQVFAGASILSLISEPVLPGDVQILGDGTPIVLMRDHQPTGGYPRIATVIRADLDRLAQMRPGTKITFQPTSVERAQALWRSRTI